MFVVYDDRLVRVESETGVLVQLSALVQHYTTEIQQLERPISQAAQWHLLSARTRIAVTRSSPSWGVDAYVCAGGGAKCWCAHRLTLPWHLEPNRGPDILPAPAESGVAVGV